jgi:hypothetical protein
MNQWVQQHVIFSVSLLMMATKVLLTTRPVLVQSLLIECKCHDILETVDAEPGTAA